MPDRPAQTRLVTDEQYRVCAGVLGKDVREAIEIEIEPEIRAFDQAIACLEFFCDNLGRLPGADERTRYDRLEPEVQGGDGPRLALDPFDAFAGQRSIEINATPVPRIDGNSMPQKITTHRSNVLDEGPDAFGRVQSKPPAHARLPMRHASR